MGELGERRWSLCCRTYTPLPPSTHPSIIPPSPHASTPSLLASPHFVPHLFLILSPSSLCLVLPLHPLSLFYFYLSHSSSLPLFPSSSPPIISLPSVPLSFIFSLFSALSPFTHPQYLGKSKGDSSCCQATRLTNEMWRTEGGGDEGLKRGRDGRKERRQGG